MNKANQIPTPIKKIGRVVTGKTPSTCVVDNFGGDYMFVTPVDLHTDFLIQESQKTLSRHGLESVMSNTINGLSIAVGCIGSVGNVALIEKECATNQQINSITDIKPEYNPYYIYYWLLTKKEYLFQIATVTSTPILNKSTFEDVLVPVPSKDVQDRVVSFLLPISKKISLNNAINAELEKAAKLLYNYWFVLFDFPDSKGKPYRASGGEMVWNEQLKREIPKGWRVLPFNNVMTENKQTLSGEIDKTNMFGLDLSIMLSDSLCLNQRGSADDFDSNRFRLSRYDLLFGSIRPYLRKAGFSAFNGVANGTIMNFRCRDEQNYSFALCTLTSEAMFQYADTRSRGNGTRMPTINATELLGHIFAYDKQTAFAFNMQVAQYWKMIADNINQNFELIALRDFLIPLLMNGQVRVVI
jgi:type I restriction enzyme S subunit